MNILILTSNTGGGHIKATEAICEHIKNKNLDYNVRSINTLDHINPTFNNLITSFYAECIKNYPDLFGKIYYYSEAEHLSINIFNLILKNLAKKFLPVILDFKTDIIISTHPFSTQMVSYLKEIGNISDVKLINLLTDYAPHKFWIHDHVDAYITASEQMTEDMIERGVDKNIIHPIGIPVGIEFSNSYNKKDIFKSIGFDENCFTILIMSGSLGVDYVIKIFKKLIKVKINLQVIIITGNNPCLYRKFKHIISNNLNLSIKFHLLGFTKHVSRYMNVCDVIISKPGGLTTTEAIASNLPIIFFNAVPGQEEKNGDFIIKNGIGMKISNSKESVNEFVNLINNRTLLNQMKQNIESIKKTNFIENLVEIIYSFYEENELKIENYTC